MVLKRGAGAGGQGPGARGQGPGPEVQDAESQGPGTSSQVRWTWDQRRGATSPVRRAQKRAIRTGVMIVGVMNKMMIVLLLALYLRSVGSMFNHIVFQRAFETLSSGEVMGIEI